MKINYVDFKEYSYKNSNLEKFLDLALIRIPLQKVQKKKVLSDKKCVKKVKDVEKNYLKPIANSFIVNSNDSQDETSLYLKKDNYPSKWFNSNSSKSRGNCSIY